MLALDSGADFKEPAKEIDLTHGHSHKKDSLKDRPVNDPRVGVIVYYKNEE